MRRLIVAAVLAAALVVPAGVAALDPAETPEQAAALMAPDKTYLPAAGNACGIEFTPNTARAWWARYFAAPLDLANVRPGLLPGSLVLTPEQYGAAVTLNARGNTLPDAPRDWNPLALPVTPGLVGADGIAFCPTDSIATTIPLGVTAVKPVYFAASRARLAALIASTHNARLLALYRSRLAGYEARAALAR